MRTWCGKGDGSGGVGVKKPDSSRGGSDIAYLRILAMALSENRRCSLFKMLRIIRSAYLVRIY